MTRRARAGFGGPTARRPPELQRLESRVGVLSVVRRRIAGKQVTDVGEQFEFGRRGVSRDRILAGFLFLERPLLDEVDRNDKREVDDDRNQQELDDRGNDRAEEDRRCAGAGQGGKGDRQRRRERLGAEQRTDQGIEHRRNDDVHDVAESGTDDDGDRKVDDVTAQDEFFESLDHVTTLSEIFGLGQPADGVAGLAAAGFDAAGELGLLSDDELDEDPESDDDPPDDDDEDPDDDDPDDPSLEPDFARESLR
jgi:hypothetical protein